MLTRSAALMAFVENATFLSTPRKVRNNLKYQKPDKMKTKSLTKVTLLTIFVMSVITAVTLNSCQKEAIKPKSIIGKQSLKANPFANSEKLLDQMNSIIFSGTHNSKGLIGSFHAYDSSSCSTVVSDTVSKPHTETFTYSPGCVGTDGVTRSGVTQISYGSTDLRLVNNVITLSFQNYVFDTSEVNGSLSFTNTGYNTNGNLVITEIGTFYILSGGQLDTFNLNYQLEWIAGESSSPLSNLQFSITGGITLTSATQTASNTITSPLIKNSKTPGCNYYIQGTVHAQRSNGYYWDVDYSNPGGCSGLFQVNENGTISTQHQ